MRISGVILSGFLVSLLAQNCSSNSTDSGGSGVDEYRNISSSKPDSGRSLSRKRRFIAFPLGSSFSVAVCMTVGVIGNPNWQYLSLGLNWGLAYNLPNATWVLEHAHGFGKKKETPEPVVKRRYRRELYGHLEVIMDRQWSIVICIDPIDPPAIITDGQVLYRLQVAVCATVGVIGSPHYSYLSYGLNWGAAYDLPNETWVRTHLHGFGSKNEQYAVIKRRNRRHLYRSVEDHLDRMGYSGRDCVLRALCESRSYFSSEKLGMIPEMLRTIFSLPKTRLYTREIQETPEIQHYNRAYFSEEDEDCEYKYPCSFSLLELAMGKYSEPGEDYYAN